MRRLGFLYVCRNMIPILMTFVYLSTGLSLSFAWSPLFVRGNSRVFIGWASTKVEMALQQRAV